MRDVGLEFQLDKIRLGSRPCREAELILVFQPFAQVLEKGLKGNRVAEPLPVEFSSGRVCHLSQQILSGVGLIAAAVEAARVAEINGVDNDSRLLRIGNRSLQVSIIRIV